MFPIYFVTRMFVVNGQILPRIELRHLNYRVSIKSSLITNIYYKKNYVK